MTDRRRPRVQFLVDRPRHAQARTARAISRYLADEFDCRVRCETDAPNLRDEETDLLYVSSWDSTWYRQFDFRPEQVIKSVLDHRWDVNAGAAGGMTAADFVDHCLADAGHVTCCSQRLQRVLEPHRPDVRLTPAGFDPFVFPSRQRWGGPLVFGWAGDPADPTTGFDSILCRAADDRFQLAVADGDPELAVIGEFFRSIDVFLLASEQEGAPLTLIEALASGCFVICVDVGVVPEIIVDGENGLVVPRDPAAFRRAFEWCAAHPDVVRRAGMRQAEHMRHRHTWEHVAERWREVLRGALEPREVATEFGISPDPVRSVPSIAEPVRS